MIKAIAAFFVSLGIVGWLSLIALFILTIIGYIMNVVKLVQHLPTLDLELAARAIGLLYGPLGALFGWFL